MQQRRNLFGLWLCTNKRHCRVKNHHSPHCLNNEEDSYYRLKLHDVYAKELTILGSNIDPFTFPEAISTVESMYEAGYLNASKLGIKNFSLKDYQSAINQLTDGSISKAMFAL